MSSAPFRLAALVVTGVTAALPVSAQKPRSTTTETDFVKDTSGVVLLHVAKGTPLVIGPTRDGLVQATIEGWLSADALRADTRAGYDVSVSPTAGSALMSAPGSGATLATARFGALFKRLETHGNWVHVRRTGWVSSNAFAAPAAAPPPAARSAPPRAAKSAPPPAPVPAATVASQPAPHNVPTAAADSATITAGSSLALAPDGPPFANIETPVAGKVIDHQNGWTRLRIDTWVPDAALGLAVTAGGITAADLRAAPDKYVGQSVEWTVQLLGVETADELRPEMPAGQPYLLTRGPLPEAGFVYVMIPKDSVDAFQRLDPLTKLRIRATIRAGKSRFLPTPIVELVRRLN